VSVLQSVPCWYWVLGAIWCTYQGARGAVEHRLAHDEKVRSGEGWLDPRSPQWKSWEKWVVLYIHDFAFRFICTASGFVALYASYLLGGDLDNLRRISAQCSVLLVFLLLVGLIGVGGQLHYAILLGKFPR
jgi:hypothetical protein